MGHLNLTLRWETREWICTVEEYIPLFKTLDPSPPHKKGVVFRICLSKCVQNYKMTEKTWFRETKCEGPSRHSEIQYNFLYAWGIEKLNWSLIALVKIIISCTWYYSIIVMLSIVIGCKLICRMKALHPISITNYLSHSLNKFFLIMFFYFFNLYL